MKLHNSSIKFEKIILSIDPGTNFLGYSFIKQARNKLELKSYGIINSKDITTHILKLENILNKTIELIKMYCPDEIAIESPFYGKNIQSMLKLGRAQGMVVSAALLHKIPITEYPPKKVKIAITGNGNSSKEQVAKMVFELLDIKDLKMEKKYYDITDAIAIGICHCLQKNSESNKNKSWKEFIKDNQDRIF